MVSTKKKIREICATCDNSCCINPEINLKTKEFIYWWKFANDEQKKYLRDHISPIWIERAQAVHWQFRGECPFLVKGKGCSIYNYRPFDCRIFFCSKFNGVITKKEKDRFYKEQTGWVLKTRWIDELKDKELWKNFKENLIKYLIKKGKLKGKGNYRIIEEDGKKNGNHYLRKLRN